MRPTSRLAAATALLVISAALAPPPAAARTVAEIKQSGELVMLAYLGSNEAFLRPAPGGGYDGLDHDLVAGFARTLGVRLKVVIKPRFQELIPALLAGEGDVIASTMSITPEREQVVDFTGPYFPAVAMFVAPRGSGLSGLASLQGKRLAVAPGTTLEARAQTMGFAEIVGTARGSQEALETLAGGAVDVVLIESSLALPLLARGEPLEIVGSLPQVEHYGLAVPPGSDLRGALDAFLANARRGRSFYQLVLRYLGEQGVELMKIQSQPSEAR